MLAKITLNGENSSTLYLDAIQTTERLFVSDHARFFLFLIPLPGGGGKVPIMPQYMISESEKRVVVRNYRGFLSVYAQPEETDCSCSTTATIRKHFPHLELEGPDRLLQGKAVGIEPKG